MPLDSAAQAFIAKVNKQLKEDLLVSADQLVVPKRFTSGSVSVDTILGGGWPGNQWVEIVGLESSGKTFGVFKGIAANQALDPSFTTLWVAAEHFDSEQAVALGVDLTRVVVVPTQQMEVALQVMLEATSSENFDCIVLDSFPALLPSEEDEKAMDEFTTAAGARILNKFIRKAGEASRRAVDGTGRPFYGIIINQYRDQIGGFAKFGVPKTTPGGKGKNYFFYCRIEVSRKEWIEEDRPGAGKVKVGQVQIVKTIKNKSAAPQQMAELGLYFRRAPFLGFSRGDYDTAREAFLMAKLLRVFDRRGSRYWFAGAEIANGEEKTMAALREDRGLLDAVRAEVLEAAADPRRLDMAD